MHGLFAECLRGHPLLHDVAADFLAFIGDDAQLIAHNASFDLGFINAELDRSGKPLIGRERLVDTLLLARRKFPAGPNSLDHLCARLGIDNSRRTKHGALLDAELLAEVYLELVDARQIQLGLTASDQFAGSAARAVMRARPLPLLRRVSDAALAAHRAFIATLGAAAIWRDYIPPEQNETAGPAE